MTSFQLCVHRNRFVCLCVCVCCTLWVVRARGEISEVPDTVCFQPPTPHISGHVVSQPPALNWMGGGGGETRCSKIQTKNSQNLFTCCELGWMCVCVGWGGGGTKSRVMNIHLPLSYVMNLAHVCNTQPRMSDIYTNAVCLTTQKRRNNSMTADEPSFRHPARQTRDPPE